MDTSKAVSVVVRFVRSLPDHAVLPVLAGVIAVGTSVGVVAGAYPAWRAARTDPIDALRYE